MSNTTLKKTAYAVILCLIALITVFYARGDFDIGFIKRPVTEEVIPAYPDKPDPEVTESADPIPEETQQTDSAPAPAEKEPTYDEVIAAFADKSAHADKHITNTPYRGGTHILARTASDTSLPAELSLRDVPTRKLVTEKNKKGSNVTTETTENAPQAAVRLYFGYILVDDGTRVALCDKSGKVLVSDVSAYKLVGYCDLSGHPLFFKDGKYYYYYDGVNVLSGTIVLDTITPETFTAEYQNTPEPTGMALIDATKYSETTPTLTGGAGMTECTVDENYFGRIACNSSYYNRTTDISRICEIRQTKTVTNQTEVDAANAAIAERDARIAAGEDPLTIPITAPVEPIYEVTDEKTFWWYVGADGNIAFNNCFIEAYDFTEDGAAFIVADEEDAPDKLTVIDPKGAVLFRAASKNYYFAENGAAKVWDGHYLPDTFGVENTGMLTFGGGFAAVRRKLLDTSNGRVFISDKTELVNTRGELFNLPKGYTLVAYSDSRLLVSKNGRYGFMKTTGQWLTGMDFEYAEAFREGLAAVCKGGKFGVIDNDGNIVIPFVFDHITSCSDGVIAAWEKDHGWSIFCKMTAEPEAEAQVNPVQALRRRSIATDVYEYAEKEKANAELEIQIQAQAQYQAQIQAQEQAN